jgi:membrane protein DedA with SNARE-associated domain
MAEAAFQWIEHHGYAGIFSLLAFGIVGLPVPDEWLLTFSGFLVFRGALRFIPTLIAAFLGSASGISVSYTLGRVFDAYVIVKYGSLFHITPERMERVHRWFEKYGRWPLLLGYFIPGVRHLTGYVAGASELPLPKFMLFAYSGAFCWAAAFISLGYFLGENWNHVLAELHQSKLVIIGGVVIGVAGYFVLKHRRGYRSEHV